MGNVRLQCFLISLINKVPMSDLRTELLVKYSEIGLSSPDWANPLPPSIPLIGKRYGVEMPILVYGSAENLSHYERKPETVPDYIQDERALDRHRAALENDPGVGFFPNVHMAPFNDGSLLVAANYYLWRTVGRSFEKPIELLECIAAANFCKFAIAGSVNKDYAGDLEKVNISLPYVVADLEVLKPSVCVLPKSILKHASVRRRLNSAAPDVQLIALLQFNVKVINMHLKKHSDDAEQMAENLRDHPISEWIDAMPGYSPGFPYRYLVEMDQVLNEFSE